MKKSLYLALAGCSIAMLASCSDDPSAKTEDSENEVVENEEISYVSSLELTTAEIQAVQDNNNFAWNFFNEISNKDNNNVVVSPLSVSIAMTMMANGAYENSEVQKEILSVLEYSDYSISEVNSATMKLADGIYRLDEEVSLALANSLWVDPLELKLNPEYTSILEKDFAAEAYDIKEASYVSDVNDWCNDKTKGMISQLLSTDSKVPDMTLIIATYFKGLWSKNVKFDKAQTVTGDFNSADGTKSTVEFMNAAHMYGSYKTDIMEVVTIPFGKGSYNFQIVRPNDNVSIEDCQQALTNGKWNELMAADANGEYLDIKLPKFDIEYGDDIKDLLADMGMTKAMNGIDYFFAFPGGLEIENIIHKAHFKIDEDGAEAAAVSYITVPEMNSGDGSETDPKTPRPFYLDHPFIYLITEKESGTIIFIGCVKSL